MTYHVADALIFSPSYQIIQGRFEQLFFLRQRSNVYTRQPTYTMSQEPEDVKPKLNLNIAYDGTRALLSLNTSPWNLTEVL